MSADRYAPFGKTRAFAFKMADQDEFALTVGIPMPTHDNPENVAYSDLTLDEARAFCEEVLRSLGAIR